MAPWHSIGIPAIDGGEDVNELSASQHAAWRQGAYCDREYRLSLRINDAASRRAHGAGTCR
jgi:hypothetical protein